MSDDFLIHDHSIILTGVTIVTYVLGQLALWLRARSAAALCAVLGFAAIGLNLAIGRPFDVSLGPFVGVEPLPIVSDAEAFGRLAVYQTVALVLTAEVLISALSKQRPRFF